MQLVKQISALILALLFLVTSSGFIMYKSHCSCTGNEQVSVFVEAEICSEDESESCCEDVITSCCIKDKLEECSLAISDCNCNKPEITYIKLVDKVVNEEISFIQVEPIEIQVLLSCFVFDKVAPEQTIEYNTSYNTPPPLFNSSQELLISIHQLKIPSLV